MARKTRRRPKREKRRQKRQAGNGMQIFYAFPALPRSTPETIDAALSILRSDQSVKAEDVAFLPWPVLNVTGKRMITEITAAIDQSAVVAFDVTHQNDNVAFELGYAIGKFKKNLDFIKRWR